MVTATRCSNPKCSCTPCLCGDDCRCGGGSRLGELEQKVMDVLWASYGRELTAREVANQLPGFAYTTIATVLNRLSRKGAVRRKMEHRLTLFTAVDTRAERAAAAMREALVSSGDPNAALVKFAEAVSPGEARVLRRALEGGESR